MNDTAELGLILPAILNPENAAVVGIAVIAVGRYLSRPKPLEELAGIFHARFSSDFSLQLFPLYLLFHSIQNAGLGHSRVYIFESEHTKWPLLLHRLQRLYNIFGEP